MVYYVRDNNGRSAVMKRVFALLVGVILPVLIVGCGPSVEVTFIAEGGSYTAADLAPLLSDADLGRLPRLDATDAAEARQDALAELRRNGEDAAALADVLTSQFPADDIAVPGVVERGRFEDTDAWFVIEATGDVGTELTGRRLWVFSAADLSVLAAQSAR